MINPELFWIRGLNDKDWQQLKEKFENLDY